MLPNFLIIGASKCGTTALYYYLKQHPEISFPELKEPKYFSSVGLKFLTKGSGIFQWINMQLRILRIIKNFLPQSKIQEWGKRVLTLFIFTKNSKVN